MYSLFHLIWGFFSRKYCSPKQSKPKSFTKLLPVFICNYFVKTFMGFLPYDNACHSNMGDRLCATNNEGLHLALLQHLVLQELMWLV